MEPLLTAEGIVATRRSACVLKGVELCAMPGELVGIEGISGAGKSTLLHILGGLRRADFGRTCLAGTPVEQLDPLQRARRVAIAMQTPVLPRELSVAELVRLGRLPHQPLSLTRRLSARTDTDREPVARAISALGLRALAECSLGAISGGEQRRAHIARVLAQEPPGLLLDEPTTHLDELTSRQLMRTLQQRAREGAAVVLVTHDAVCLRHCSRTLRLENGTLLPVPQRQHQIRSVTGVRETAVDNWKEDSIR